MPCRGRVRDYRGGRGCVDRHSRPWLNSAPSKFSSPRHLCLAVEPEGLPFNLAGCCCARPKLGSAPRCRDPRGRRSPKLLRESVSTLSLPFCPTWTLLSPSPTRRTSLESRQGRACHRALRSPGSAPETVGGGGSPPVVRPLSAQSRGSAGRLASHRQPHNQQVGHHETPPPLKRWSPPFVHKAQATDQQFRVRPRCRRSGFPGLFLGTYSAFAYAALCNVASRTRSVCCGFAGHAFGQGGGA
jgi:hypothetical protein